MHERLTPFGGNERLRKDRPRPNWREALVEQGTLFADHAAHRFCDGRVVGLSFFGGFRRFKCGDQA